MVSSSLSYWFFKDEYKFCKTVKCPSHKELLRKFGKNVFFFIIHRVYINGLYNIFIFPFVFHLKSVRVPLKNPIQRMI